MLEFTDPKRRELFRQHASTADSEEHNRHLEGRFVLPLTLTEAAKVCIRSLTVCGHGFVRIGNSSFVTIWPNPNVSSGDQIKIVIVLERNHEKSGLTTFVIGANVSSDTAESAILSLSTLIGQTAMRSDSWRV